MNSVTENVENNEIDDIANSIKIDEEVIEYELMNDEEIIYCIRQKDTSAQDFMLEKYKPLVKAKSRAYFLVGADNEDIIQEGMIGLYKAIRDFSAHKHASFYSFAELCINRQLITAVKASTRQKHMPLNNYVSLNKPAYDEDSQESYIDNIKAMDSDNPENMIIGREAKAGIENHLVKNLSRFESTVLSLYLDKKTYADIAKITGKPEKSVDNALQRVKKKLEKYLGE